MWINTIYDITIHDNYTDNPTILNHSGYNITITNTTTVANGSWPAAATAIAANAGLEASYLGVKSFAYASTVNDNDIGSNLNGTGQVAYTGSWSLSSLRGLGDFSDDAHATSTNNDSVEFTFNGTSIDYVTEKNSDQGDVDVYIDNVFQQTVSTYNASRLVKQVVYSKTGLSSGSHTMKLVKKSGSYMLVDAFVVYSPVNNTDSKVKYPGSWSNSANRGYGDYQNDVQYTTTNNDSVEFSFIGTSVNYITEKNSDQGDVNVYIYDVLMQTISTYNATRLAQLTAYSISGLTEGMNKIKLVKKTGTYMLVDAFNYR